MKIGSISTDWRQLTNAQKGRTQGRVHVSDCVHDLMARTDPRRFGAPRPAEFDAGTQGRMEIGSAFEYYDKMKRRASGVIILDDEEYEVDGILLTPDGLTPEERVWEWKLTWASTAHDWQEQHWYYLPQIMAYCRACHVLEATLVLVNVNGTYKPMEPTIREIPLTFTPRELDENWRKILGAKKRITR